MRLILLFAVSLVACRYEPPGQQPSRKIPEPKFSAPCEALIPLRVGHDVRPPAVIFKVPPREVGVIGIVIVALIVESTGRVCDAVVVRGLAPVADLEALDTIRRWRYRPARLRGEPRAAVFYVTVKFD